MSCTLKVTPFSMTARVGSGKRIAAEAHPSQIPVQNGTQRPTYCHARTPQTSRRERSHWLSSTQNGAVAWASIPNVRDT